MIEITKYKNSVLPIGQSGRISLDLKINQEVYIYEDIKNMQIVLSPYEIKPNLYRSTFAFKDINKYIKFGIELSQMGINIFSINLYRYVDGYRMSIVYEIREEHKQEWKETNVKGRIEKTAKKYGRSSKAGEDEIKILDFIEYSENESNEKIRNIILPLIKLFTFDKKILKPARISKNWTIYYSLSNKFVPNDSDKSKYTKCVQIAESDIGVLLLKFYEDDVIKINIELLNFPGSFVRLIYICICKYINIDIVAIDLQRISFEIGGTAESVYILKYSGEIKNELNNKGRKEKEVRLKEILNNADSDLRKTDEFYKKLVEPHDRYISEIEKLKKLTDENKLFVKNITMFE